MYAKIFKSSVVATMITLLVATGSAFADRDRKGDGGGRDRGGGNEQSSRSFSGGSERSSRSSASRSSNSDRSSRSAFRSSDSDRNVRSSESNRSRTYRSQDSNRQSIQSGQSGSQFRQGTREYQARRPSDDQVRDFLKQGDNRQGDNTNRVRTRERSPQEREFVDRQYNQWQNTWKGDKNDGRDHRDWSGNWKDSDRFDVADRIRRDWNDRKEKDREFGGDWWRTKHRGNYWDFWGDHAHRHNRPWYWWSWATGPRLGSWIVFGWPTPYYWDYGRGEYLYYDNGAIYVNGRWYQPAPVFYDQTVRIVEQAPELTAEAAATLEWLPLGVFAITPDGLAEPMITVQLAVTKDGMIGGTAFDQKSGAAFNIQGMVDKRSQRAVWSYTNDQNKRIIMETSVYNLTQPEATGLVHYGPNDMRVIELVRLQDPTSAAQPPATAPSELPVPNVSN